MSKKNMEILIDEQKLTEYVLGKLNEDKVLELVARNNTLTHFNHVCCDLVESVIVHFINDESSEEVEWLAAYLDKGEGRANPFNLAVSEAYWNSKRNYTKYRIHFWHGLNSPEYRDKYEKAMMEKIEVLCTFDGEAYFYEGTLDDFAAIYEQHFMVRPANTNQWFSPLICVTAHANFGQR